MNPPNVFLVFPKKVYLVGIMETTTKKERRGGFRVNGGRKPAEDPKKSIFIWIEGSVVEKLGGEKAAKAAAEAHLRRKAKIV